jgi:hypothetical protein
VSGAASVSFAARVSAVRADLSESMSRAGLVRDPYGRMIEAQSAALEIFPEFLDEMRQAQAPWTDDERRAAVADAVARMDARLAFRMIQFNRWAVCLAVLLGMAMACAAWGGGYRWGYSAAEDRLITVPAAFGDALAGRDAGVWVSLIRNNDISRANRSCNEQNGRKACAFWLWTEPAPPRAAGAH